MKDKYAPRACPRGGGHNKKSVATRLALVLILVAALLVFCAQAGLARDSRSFKDETGRTVKLAGPPQRIVALTPSLVEILFALGLKDKIVGATTWADYPPAAKKLPRVGAYVSPNLEKIASLAPDLVLVNREGNPPWVLDKLAQAHIPVYVTVPDHPKNLPAGIERLGRVCGAERRGRELAQKLRRQFALLEKRIKGAPLVKVLVVIGSRPLVSASPNSYTGRILAMAGAGNISPADAGTWPRLNLEFVVQAQPRLVIISTMERGQDLQRELEYWRAMPGLAGTPGYRVVHMQSDLIDRPGPRLGQGLWTLAKIIHPGLFAPEESAP